MAFHIENMEVVDFAGNKLVTRVLPDGIEIHSARYLTVLPANVYRQAVVDKHPHIVVAVKIKILPRNVFKRRLDFCGIAEVMLSDFCSLQLVVIRVRNRLRFVEKFKIVQQEHAVRIGLVAFRNLVFGNFSKPESFVVHRHVKVAASHVGILVAFVVFGNDFGQKPTVEMFRNLAFFGERVCTHGDSVFAEVVFDHACDGLVLAGTSARTKVGTDSVCGVTIFAATVAVAFGTVQPVVNGHGNFLERTIAEYARVARKLRRNIGLVALHPDGVRKCRHGIERYFARGHRFFSHHALGAHVIQANGLLEVDVEILFGCVDGRLEPTAVIV